MRRLLLYIFTIFALVSCEVGFPNEDVSPSDPKPVRPIKPRPIVPDGTILRPRIGIRDIITLPKPLDGSYPCRMQLCTQRGEVLYDDEVMVCDGFVELPNVRCGAELILIIEKESATYCFTIAEMVE